MKKRITKKLIAELQNLSNTYGYWSKEVLEFNSKLPYHISYKINQLIKR